MPRSRLLVLAATAAASGAAAVVGFLPINPAGADVAAQQVGICTGCPVPPTTAPPALAPTTTTTTAKPNSAAPTAPAKPPVRVAATLNQGQVRPKPKKVPANAKGAFAGIVSNDVLSWAVSTDNVPVGIVRLRQGAPGKNGPIIVVLGKVNGAGAGNLAVSDGQEALLRNARVYVELVTGRNAGGELRGQLR